jgi:carotenoid 1,2-hydratase
VSFSLDISLCSGQLSLVAIFKRACATMPQTPSRLSTHGPGFDCDVGGDGGYVWWYVDAISDDGRHGLTMIAFIGSVFSPYYAWSNWTNPFEHCAINVALYRLDGRGGRWAMTERGAKSLRRDADHFQVGPSALSWHNGVLTADINEITMPIPSRLTGKIVLRPSVQTDAEVVLDARGGHIWRPLAPRARVDVSFSSPDLSWSGDAYFDTNSGNEPLERAFKNWHWGRAHRADDLMLFYDVVRRDGSQDAFAYQVDADGAVTSAPSPPTQALASTFWGIDRTAWADLGADVKVIKTLEDTPFYARSALATRLNDQPVTMMHESLNLDRLQSPIVRAMLPFRMPRRSF